MEQLYVNKGAVGAIAKRLGCCRPTVTKALQGKNSRSKLARRIRDIARLEYGGSAGKPTIRLSDRIVVPYGVMEQIGVAFGVCQMTVRKALHGRTDTYKAREIRTYALEKGGGYRVDEAGHMKDTVRYMGNMMVQHFGHSVVLRVDKNSGEAWLFHGKTLLDHRMDVGIEVLMKMQAKADAYSCGLEGD